MAALENPPESLCFGCGPHHPRGLHLTFERRTAADGVDEVVCEYTPKADEIGWPGLMHIGLLFMVLMETSYWAALTLGGRVMTVTGPVTFEFTRLPRVGLLFVCRARFGAEAGKPPRVTCLAETATGKAVARMSSTWQRESRAAVQRAGIALPSYLLEDMDP